MEILARYNRTVNPKGSTVCADCFGRRSMGQFFPVVSITKIQLDASSQGLVLLETSKFTVRNGRKLKYFNCQNLQISEKFDDHNLLSTSELHKLLLVSCFRHKPENTYRKLEEAYF